MPSLTRQRSRPYGPGPHIGSLTQTIRSASGTSVAQNVQYSGSGWSRGIEYCDDAITISGPYEDHSFTLVKRSMKTAQINGSYTDLTPWGDSWEWTFNGYCSDERLGNTMYLNGLPLRDFNPNYWATKALAGVNPNVPTVDLPLFLFELKDFPRMLRDLGRVLQKQVKASDVPGGYLAYQFGWKPLISDALSLLNLQQDISRRMNVLSQTNSGRGVARTLSRETSEVSQPSFMTLRTALDGRALTVAHTYSTQRRVWYKGKLTMPPEAKDELSRLLGTPGWNRTSFLLGFSSMSASSIWEAIPWSWLVDYFINVGDVLEAGRGSLPFNLSSVNIMVHDTYTETTQVVRNDLGLDFIPHKGVVESKRRYVIANATPRLTLEPGLTEHQTSILAALLTASALRRSNS